MQHTLLRWSVTQLGLWPKDLTWAAATPHPNEQDCGQCQYSHFPLKNLEMHSQLRCLAHQGHAGEEHTAHPVTGTCHLGGFMYCINTEGQYVICCMYYSLLLIPFWTSVQGEKNNPKKLRAIYGTRSHWERTNKKVSKTPPSKFQARAKERNGEKAVATSIFIFQLACIQLPAKGFSCDKKGCKVPKQDMVVLPFFSGSWVRNPCPFFFWGHSSSPGDGKPISQRVGLLSETLMPNCHKSIPTLMLRLLLPHPRFHPFLLTLIVAQDPLMLLNPSEHPGKAKLQLQTLLAVSWPYNKNSLQRKFSSAQPCARVHTHMPSILFFCSTGINQEW